ncbi:MAG: invasion associated locus B family protein [Gammaproteobacteria bacterium]|nr:invasion associated locus B family protein [Gammaproteobacteria bacterium]
MALNPVIGFGQDVDGKQVPIAVFTFPLGIYLPAGAAIRVDEGEPVRLEIERCINRGCQSAVALEPAQLETFKAGREAIVTIGRDREQAVDLRVSLSGFSAAYDALTAANAQGN